MFEGSDANDYVKSSPPKKYLWQQLKHDSLYGPWENHYTYDTNAFFQNLYILKVCISDRQKK